MSTTARTSTTHRMEHSVLVAAPADRVYAWIADVTRWPVVFGPTVFVEHLSQGPDWERFQIWATVNGVVSGWSSRRTFDPERLVITFAQERSQAPIAAMSGSWRFTEVAGGTEVTLVHEFTGTDPSAATEEWIRRALDRNSEAELGALRRVAELGHPAEDICFTFEDTLPLDGSIEEAYLFVHRAGEWPKVLPHVQDVNLTETADGVQDLQLDTRTADGSTHRTRSTRICFPYRRIAYKQHEVPDLLLGHSGVWTWTPSSSAGSSSSSGSGSGSRGTMVARHSVLIAPDKVESVLGAGTSLADASAVVREALGGNSRATMDRAAAFARVAGS